MSSMKYIADERGSVALVATIALLGVLLLGAIGFGAWAFAGRQEYKTEVEAKIETAVTENTKVVQAKEAERYAEEAKNPLKVYTGAEIFGSLRLEYPKTWSAYIESENNNPLSAYFDPNYVPSINDEKAVHALRVQIVSAQYSRSLSELQGLQKEGSVTVTPYALPKTPSAVGVRVDGQIAEGKQGSMVVLPVRDKTLKIWVESSTYLNDFNTIILPNASFSP